MNSDKMLGILPGGTMNLFDAQPRPPAPTSEEADRDLCGGIRSKGGHRYGEWPPPMSISSPSACTPELVKLREKAAFKSRLGKMRASTVAAIQTLFDPPRLKGKLKLDDRTIDLEDTKPGNLQQSLRRRGHLPYADQPDAARSASTSRSPTSRATCFALRRTAFLGHWKSAPEIDRHQARKARLEVPPSKRKLECSIDRRKYRSA